MRFRQILGGALAALLLACLPAGAFAWSHQGHILITRLAALRIINDPTAPAGLRDFLKANMPHDLESCKKLATEQTVGIDGEGFLAGLDGACTLPDRIQDTPEGKKDIAPYGMPEAKMHFMDMEWLSKNPTYKPDLSNCPTVADIPHDLKDPRWKMAGFVPFRVEESYNNLVAAFGPAGQPVDNAAALHWAGYLLHYVEDCHQPQHATVDYKSLSYLAGTVKQVHKITRMVDGQEAVDYRVDGRDINPHGAVEYQLFADTLEPRKTLRAEFWKELIERIDKKAAAEKTTPASATPPARYGSFTRALEILHDSYQYLPAVGKAAAAGYATGTFDPKAFFESKDTVHGQEMDLVQIKAQRNADAVIEVEKTLRQAWADAKGAPEKK